MYSAPCILGSGCGKQVDLGILSPGWVVVAGLPLPSLGKVEITLGMVISGSFLFKIFIHVCVLQNLGSGLVTFMSMSLGTWKPS